MQIMSHLLQSDSDDTVDLAIARQQQAEETSSSGQRREQQRKRPRRITADHHHLPAASIFVSNDLPSTSQRHRAQPTNRISRPRRLTSPIAAIRYRREQFAASSDSD